MQDCKPISIPFPINCKLSSSMSLNNEATRRKMSRISYALVVGSLMYVMICPRPDIAQTIVISIFMENPGGEHWSVIKRILKYIKGTLGDALCFGGSELVVKGYVDSDFAGDLDKRRSATAYVSTLVGRDNKLVI